MDPPFPPHRMTAPQGHYWDGQQTPMRQIQLPSFNSTFNNSDSITKTVTKSHSAGALHRWAFEAFHLISYIA